MPPSPRQKRYGGLLLLPLALFCCSCSGEGLNTVQGTVTLKGAPIKGAQLFFHLKGGDGKAQRPSAVTKEDGTFTVTTGNKPGAPPGDYVVTIVWPDEEGPMKFKKGSMDQEAPPSNDRLKGRYANAANSPLSATIKGGSNKLNPFDLN